VNERARRGGGYATPKLLPVSSCSRKLWIFGGVEGADERKGESREKALGVQGHALSQIINFSPFGRILNGRHAPREGARWTPDGRSGRTAQVITVSIPRRSSIDFPPVPFLSERASEHSRSLLDSFPGVEFDVRSKECSVPPPRLCAGRINRTTPPSSPAYVCRIRNVLDVRYRGGRGEK